MNWTTLGQVAKNKSVVYFHSVGWLLFILNAKTIVNFNYGHNRRTSIWIVSIKASSPFLNSCTVVKYTSYMYIQMLWYFYYTYLHQYVNLGMYKCVHFLYSMQKLSKIMISAVVIHQLFYTELQIFFGCPLLNVSESLSLNIVMFWVSLKLQMSYPVR